MGYETNSSLLNLGTVGLGLAYYIIKLAIYLVAVALEKYFNEDEELKSLDQEGGQVEEYVRSFPQTIA